MHIGSIQALITQKAEEILEKWRNSPNNDPAILLELGLTESQVKELLNVILVAEGDPKTLKVAKPYASKRVVPLNVSIRFSYDDLRLTFDEKD